MAVFMILERVVKKQKPRAGYARGFHNFFEFDSTQRFDVGRFWTFVRSDRVKLYQLILSQALKAIDLNSGVVDEQVRRAVFRGDESVTFLIIEPLNFSLHVNTSCH